MYQRALLRMRELVRTSRYVLTVHAAEELEADGLTLFDAEHGILSGEIVERQKDHESGEWKYVVDGATLSEDPVRLVVKISPTNKLVFITVFRG